jgi:hypothetical protein
VTETVLDSHHHHSDMGGRGRGVAGPGVEGMQRVRSA